MKGGSTDMRRLVPGVISMLCAIVLIASPAQAAGHGGWQAVSNAPNNNVQVVSGQQGEFRYLTGVDVTTDPTPTVDNQNSAMAEGTNCTGCRTVAVAVQVVIDTANVTNFQPQNVAVAFNDQCTSCLTFAYAHQYVIQVDHPVWLSDDGREEASAIQYLINRVAASNEDFATMSSQLDQLSLGLYNVVLHDTQSQKAGDHGDTERRTATVRD